MSKNVNDIIHKPSNCISEAEMQAYVSGKLSNADMHRVEKHLLDCELCSDAMEGLQMLKSRDSVRELEKGVDKILREEKGKQPVMIWFKENIRYVAVAAVVVMAVGAFLLKDALRDESNIAFNESVKQEKEAQPADVAEKPKEIQSDSIRLAPGSVTVTSNGTAANASGVTSHAEVMDESLNAEGAMITPAPEPVLASKDDNKPVTIVMKDVNYAATEPEASREKEKQKSEEVNPPAGMVMAPQSNVKTESPERSAKTAKKTAEAPAKPSESTGSQTEHFFDSDKKENTAPSAVEYKFTSQDSTSMSLMKESDNEPYSIVEQMPAYPGGDSAMIGYLKRNLKDPRNTKEALNSEFTIYIGFIVDTDGAVKEVSVLRGSRICKPCDEEAVRVVKSMPRWKPGKNAGKPVPVRYNLPIKFKKK